MNPFHDSVPAEGELGEGATTRPPGRRRGVPRWEKWVIAGIILLAIVSVSGAFLYLGLRSPLPGSGPSYDVLTFGAVAATLVPGEDLLLQTNDGRIGLYLPRGAYLAEGTFVLSPRRPEVTPNRTDSDVQRLFPVDVFLIRQDGVVTTSIDFEEPGLLCFALSPDLQELVDRTPSAVRVQMYDESRQPEEWIDLPKVPGWQPQQACTAVDHLSLFALAVTRSTSPPEAVTPFSNATPAAEAIYSVQGVR